MPKVGPLSLSTVAPKVAIICRLGAGGIELITALDGPSPYQ